mmetsp:Transcript_21258/g.50534  ORF Transcript_21258/g.50534 Transcript_21258/m.50534 type:complete len:223 (-) Transcript_21258:201-869(-)
MSTSTTASRAVPLHSSNIVFEYVGSTTNLLNTTDVFDVFGSSISGTFDAAASTILVSNFTLSVGNDRILYSVASNVMAVLLTPIEPLPAAFRTIDDDNDSNNADAVGCLLLLLLSTRFNKAPNRDTADIASLSDRFTNNAFLIASSLSMIVFNNNAASPCEMALSHALVNAAAADGEDEDARTRTSFCSASGTTLTSVVDDDDEEDVAMISVSRFLSLPLRK